MAIFLKQVKKVLRPLGCFFFADFRHKDEIPALQEQIAASGMKLVAWECITENVLRALELDHERKFELLRKKAPPLMAGILGDFIGTRGSSIYRLLDSRENEYIHCVLQNT